MRSLIMRSKSSGGRHSAPITSVALQRHGELLASTSYDGSVLIWNVLDPARPQAVARLEHRRLANSATWNPYNPALLATASADKTIAVWDLANPTSPKRLNVLARHTDDINSVAWLPDGERLVAVSEDGRASLWNGVRGTYEDAIASHAAHCMMVDISREGRIATVGEDGLVSVRTADSSQAQSRQYESSVEGCAWSNAGDLLALARDDGSVEVLTSSLDVHFTVQVASSAARSVSWSDDDQNIVVGAYDGGVHLLDRRGRVIASTVDERFWPRSVSVAGQLVAVGSFWAEPHLLRLGDLSTVSNPSDATYGVNAMSTDGQHLLLGDDAGRILSTISDASENVVREELSLSHPTGSPILSLASDGHDAWAGTYAGYVVNRDGTSKSVNLGAPIPSLIVDGDRLVAGTYNGELVELSRSDLSVIRRREAYDGSIKSLAPRPGTTQFASASTDRIVGLGTFEDRVVLWEHGNLVNAVAVSSNGEVVASASRDHTIKVGVIGDRGAERVLSLLAPDESIKAVAVLGSTERPVILAGSYDFGIYAWHVDWNDDASSLKAGDQIKYVGQGVSTILSLDENRAVVVGWDGSLVHYEIDAGQIVEIADHAVEEVASSSAA